MEHKCCEINDYSDISILNIENFKNRNTFERIIKVISKGDVPFSCDGQNIMVCSPVGNQVKYKDSIKADIILSGFCTAPEAAKNYLTDQLKDEFWECRHTFNTRTMKNGIVYLLNSIGVIDAESVYNRSICNSEYIEGFNFLFTQMLCMISHNGSSKATDVMKCLKQEYKKQIEIEVRLNKNNNVINSNLLNMQKKSLLNQANQSLNSWYSKLKAYAKNGCILIIMGNEAIDLLSHSWIDDKGIIKIDFKKMYKQDSLKSLLESEFELYTTYHGAAFVYESNKIRWLLDERRLKINDFLKRKFRNYIV